MTKPTVAVCTPWCDHRELLDPYMAMIEAGPSPDELIIVDNASEAPLAFATIRLDENAGFCGGSNAGLAHATSDIVVFLNNDVVHTIHGWLDALVKATEPTVIAGAKLRTDPHASVDGRLMPYLDGWCLAGYRETFLDLGGFEESLAEPGYFSDNLLCLEARAMGITLREVKTGLVHTGGVTSQPSKNPLVQRATIENRARYQSRARELLALTV